MFLIKANNFMKSIKLLLLAITLVSMGTLVMPQTASQGSSGGNGSVNYSSSWPWANSSALNTIYS